MKKSIIFNNELEFRKKIIIDSNMLSKLYIFKDDLDNIIYFYAILIDKSIYATKIHGIEDLEYYKNIYNDLLNELSLKKEIINSGNGALKLIKK